MPHIPFFRVHFLPTPHLFLKIKTPGSSQGFMHGKDDSFSHPDFTVGSGIAPDQPNLARGLYRRLGIELGMLILT
jgi:hypothetical protein